MKSVFVMALSITVMMLAAGNAKSETIQTDQGTSTWPESGLTGAKGPGNSATVTVTTTTTVNAGNTAEVKYQIGTVTMGTFNVLHTTTSNLAAGADQQVQFTFNNMSQAQQYTVKVSVKYNDLAPNHFTDRTITVSP